MLGPVYSLSLVLMGAQSGRQPSVRGRLPGTADVGSLFFYLLCHLCQPGPLSQTAVPEGLQGLQTPPRDAH